MASVDLTSFLDVEEGEELDVFRYSAKLCILRSFLIDEVRKTNQELQMNYMSDEAFLEHYTNRYRTRLDSGFWGPMAMGVAVAAGLLSNVLGWTILLAIVTLGLAACVVILYTNNDKKKARAAAENQLIGYRKDRENHNKQIPTLQKAQKELPLLIDKCVKALKAMEGNRECITEQYWPAAPYLLEYVDTHRADNLKEALRVYREEQNYKECQAWFSHVNSKIESMHREMEEQLRDMREDIAYSELQSDLNTFLTITAIYDAANN